MAFQTKIVGTGFNESTAGPDKPWAGATNITADDNTDAGVYAEKNCTSQRLKGTMAGNLFTLPSGATVDGIRVRAEIWAAHPVWNDYEIQLVLAGTSGQGTDHKRSAATKWPLGRTVIDWGNATDDWGLTLDDTDINNSGFGAGIRTENTTSTRSDCYVDYIQITVWYTEGTKDADGEATTAVTTDDSVTKTTSLSEGPTTSVTTSVSVTKTTSVEGSATTAVTTDKTVAVVKPVDGDATTAVTTDLSITKTTSLSEGPTTAVTTDTSVTKTTSIEDDATTAVTTDVTVTKTTDISGTATTAVTTDHEALVVKPAEGEATTGVTTDATITKTAIVEESDTTSVTTDLTITKTTSAEDDATTAITTSTSVTKTTSVEGSATTSITTDHLVEVPGAQDAEGEATTAVTTSTSITKTTSVEGTATTAVTTFSWAALDYYGEITDSVSTGDTTRGGLVVADSVRVKSRAQADNYAPLIDMKPNTKLYGFTTTSATKKLIPMGDVTSPSEPAWYKRHASSFWQLVDNDVDLIDTTDHIRFSGLVEGPPDEQLELIYSSLPSEWGSTTKIDFRLRITGDFDTNYQGANDDAGFDWKIKNNYDNTIIGGGVTYLKGSSFNNEIITFTVSGLDLNILEVNSISTAFVPIGHHGVPAEPPDLYAPEVKFYAIDMKVYPFYREKQIGVETFQDKGSPASSFSDGKDISDPGWTEDDGPINTFPPT